MLKYQIFQRPLGTRNLERAFHVSRLLNGMEEFHHIETMMETGYVPPANTTETRPYTVPHAVLSSWLQQRRATSAGRFKDVSVVKLRSGDGGNGKISFLRASGRATGPPDGGDGGAGGHIYVQAVSGLHSLHHVRHVYNAANGRQGGTSQLTGKRGENVILQVPVGTRIYWCPPLDELKKAAYSGTDLTCEVPVVTNVSRFDYDPNIQLTRESFKDGAGGWVFKEKEEERWVQTSAFKKLIPRIREFDLLNRRSEQAKDVIPINGIDLTQPGEPVQLLTGGVGGLGNMHFQTADLRSPNFAKMGRQGIEGNFILELKLLADLGLVGLPNAGKSTLLRAISRARPEVGHWEFTTLTPSIGTISLGPALPSFTVADIPGIVSGANAGKGLGLGFLRHIERSGGLVFVVSLASEDPVADLQTLESELGPKRISNKKILVVGTKADLDGTEENFARLQSYLSDPSKEGWSIVPCSAEFGSVEGVIQRMGQTLGIVKMRH